MTQLPVEGGAAKRTYVREMFTAIAPTYDRLNRIISFRMDLAWRRRAVRRLGWERMPAGRYLDRPPASTRARRQSRTSAPASTPDGTQW